MTSLKGMDPYEASSTALNLPPEEWINQVGDSDKVRNSISWQYLTEFMLDVIRAPEGETQEIPNPGPRKIQTTTQEAHPAA